MVARVGNTAQLGFGPFDSPRAKPRDPARLGLNEKWVVTAGFAGDIDNPVAGNEFSRSADSEWR